MYEFEDAAKFAADAHRGQKRKLNPIPYVVHPMEVAAIIATMTDDTDIITAGILHDTVEDCGVSPVTIAERFSWRVAKLVISETESEPEGLSKADTWLERKKGSLEMLRKADDVGVKMLWLADKLANVRSFYRTYLEVGTHVWDGMHQHDPAVQEWYYRNVQEECAALAETVAYREYSYLLDRLFADNASGIK